MPRRSVQIWHLRPNLLIIVAGFAVLQTAESFGMSPPPALARSAHQYFGAVPHHGRHVLPCIGSQQLRHPARQPRNPAPTGVCMMLRTDGLSAGVKAARFIMDDKERAILKREVKAKFPLVPSSIIDKTIDEMADLIRKSTPKDLQLLLSPGARSHLHPYIVRSISFAVPLVCRRVGWTAREASRQVRKDPCGKDRTPDAGRARGGYALRLFHRQDCRRAHGR